MANKIEHAAQVATQGGAAIAGSAYAMFSLGWWNENSAAIVAIAAVFGAFCSAVGICVSVYIHYRRRI